MRDKLAHSVYTLPDILSRSVAAMKPNDPLTRRTHDERTKGRNAMRASRFVIDVTTERGTRQPVLSDLKLQRCPLPQRAVILRLKFARAYVRLISLSCTWKAKLTSRFYGTNRVLWPQHKRRTTRYHIAHAPHTNNQITKYPQISMSQTNVNYDYLSTSIRLSINSPASPRVPSSYEPSAR